MTRGELLGLFERQRLRWLESAAGRTAVARMQQRILEEGREQSAEMLSDDGGWRVSLQALGLGAALPIHDHPGTRGLLWVAAGVLRVRRFDVVAYLVGGRTALLACRGERILRTGEYHRIGLHRHNLHSLESQAVFTLVFSVRQRIEGFAERRAYALLRELGPGESTGVALVKPLSGDERLPDAGD